MKLLIVCLFIASVTAEAPIYNPYSLDYQDLRNSAPYPASGWRPTGPSFGLPARQQQPSYLAPQQNYGVPEQKFGTQSSQQQPAYLPARQQQQQQQPSYLAPQQNYGVPEQTFGTQSSRQQPDYLPPQQTYGGPQQTRQQQSSYLPPQQTYGAPEQTVGVLSRQQQLPQFAPPQTFSVPTQTYGPPAEEYGPPPPPPPTEATTTETQDSTTTELPTTTETFQNLEQAELVDVKKNNETDSKNEKLVDSGLVEQGVYYIYHPTGLLQRIVYKTQDDMEKMAYTAQLKYENVEPIRGPIYTYDAATGALQLIRA